MLQIDVITLFPEYFSGVLSTSILGRAIKSGIVHVDLHNLRHHGGGQTIKSLSEIERRFALLDRDMEVAEPYAQELSFPPVSFELTLEDATAVQAKSRR